MVMLTSIKGTTSVVSGVRKLFDVDYKRSCSKQEKKKERSNYYIGNEDPTEKEEEEDESSNSSYSLLDDHSDHSRSSIYSTVSKSQPPSATAEELLKRCPPISFIPSKRKYHVAVFACGEFWNPQRRFQRLVGVKDVIVGYTGGGKRRIHPHPFTLPPTFDDMQDYAQALRIEYNPKRITYKQLLQCWYENDCPWEPSNESEYRSGIYPITKTQYVEATDYLHELVDMKRTKHLSLLKQQHQQQLEVEQGEEHSYYCDDALVDPIIYVDLEYATTFYKAEEYHQDYIMKQIQEAKAQQQRYKKRKVHTGLHAIVE